MFFIKHAPVIGILIALIFLAFINIQIGDAGKNSDAAGAGMAKGYTMLFYGAILAVYVALILISFIWYRGTKTQLSGFKISYHLLLYLPLIFMAGYCLIMLQEIAYDRNRQTNSYEKWQEIAETKKFNSERLKVNFSYSNIGRGTFNTSYFEDVEIVETNDSVVLIGIFEDKRSFRGMIKEMPPPLSKVTVPANSSCNFVDVKDHIFKLADDLIVKKFEPSLDCNYAYINTIDFSRFDFEFWPKPKDVYFIVEAAGNQPKWLVITTDDQVLIGPLENNFYGEDPIYWFNTINLGE
jgi:predicted RNA-binding protein